MITLAIINYVAGIGAAIFQNILGNLISPLTDIATFVTAFYVPQTILDVFAVVSFFLPLQTIGFLTGLTFLIVIFKAVVSFVHFLGFGLVFGE